MRNFPSRSSWGSNKRDRVSLLSNTTAKSPTPTSSFRAQSHTHEVDSSFEKPSAFSSQKELSPSDGAIQFVPAYQEALSPATTQPLSSPEHSFSLDNEPKPFRRSTTPDSASKAVNTRTPRFLDSKSYSAQAAPPSRKNSGTRMQRLASLFSSRAVVKNLDETLEAAPCPSPPRSESSSGYVGWPGTQDKRGAMVAMEQSSYEDSDAARSRSDATSSADFNLAAAVVNAAAAANSPLRRPQSEAEKVHRMAAPLQGDVQGIRDIYGDSSPIKSMKALSDPWGMDVPADEAMSDLSTNYSKTSSAYFIPRDTRSMREEKLLGQTYNRKVAASVMRLKADGPQPLSEEALRLNDHFSPPHKTFNASNAMGYRGLLDKARDVPNLMDGTESVSTQSTMSNTHHTVRKTRTPRGPIDPEEQILEEVSSDLFGVGRGGARGADAESDIFDGISQAGVSKNSVVKPKSTAGNEEQFTLGAAPRDDQENLNLVLLGGGLTTIQTTGNDFSKRHTASDFDENLSISDYDQYGFAKIPSFNEMAEAGKRAHDKSFGSVTQPHDQASVRARALIERYKDIDRNEPGSDASGSSLFSNPYQREGFGTNIQRGLQQYYVHPDEMKSLVRRYRKLSTSRSPDLGYDDLEREEDATKAFALSEMRSRIMEKDIERGLERRGGTTVVDDLVLTPYNRTAMRVRDALIVAKAWRDGATPQDVVNTALLTRRPEKAYYILRQPNVHRNRVVNRSPEFLPAQRYVWEEVSWLDDLELSRYTCHSVGPRHLRGYEMFTIGDCQSILLKLCNQHCVELRQELNEATSRQIEAEDLMKAEGDQGDGTMTEAEMVYLASMEEVKTISHKLVVAEKSFDLVRERIEKLVAKYEALLVKFDNDAESIAPSSVITADSSYYSGYTGSFEEEQEREALARRAQRAEIRAELAAREARLTKQRAHELRKEKETEIQILQKRLQDLQSESSAAIANREHSAVLARAIALKNKGISTQLGGKPPVPNGRSRIDDVKQRFRNRAAARNQAQAGGKQAFAGSRPLQDAAARERSALYRAVGEEMYQHLDFYERSLKAVNANHS